MNVLIIGAGELGTALAKVLAPKKYNLCLWDKSDERNVCGRPFEDVVKEAEFIFLCIPSTAILEIGNRLKGLVSEKTLVISMAKGLLEEEPYLLHRGLGEILSHDQIILMSGPMLGEELPEKGGSAVIACSNEVNAKKALDLFNKTKLKGVSSKDLVGVAWCGILKNIYAIGLGILDTLEMGSNKRGQYISLAISEMLLFSKSQGGEDKTVLGLSGLGDFAATGLSNYSSNRQLGKNLVEQGVCAIKSEGCRSLPILVNQFPLKLADYPLLLGLTKIVLHKGDPKKTFEQLLS